MIAFFIFITILFIVMAIALPEWFGITGKKAREIHQHQHSSDKKDDPGAS